jgi:hypothetical protein
MISLPFLPSWRPCFWLPFPGLAPWYLQEPPGTALLQGFTQSRQAAPSQSLPWSWHALGKASRPGLISLPFPLELAHFPPWRPCRWLITHSFPRRPPRILFPHSFSPTNRRSFVSLPFLRRRFHPTESFRLSTTFLWKPDINTSQIPDKIRVFRPARLIALNSH